MLRKLFGHLSRQVQQALAEGIISLIEVDPNARLLDLGCWNGEFTERIIKHIGAARTIGCDVEPEALAQAKTRGIETCCVDLDKELPFSSNSFDVVHANQVIEHLSNTDSFIKEIYRVLSPNGYACISTPNLASLPNIAYLLVGLQPYDASVSDEVVVGSYHPIKVPLGSTYPMGMRGHRRLFTLRALEGLIDYHGFKVEKVMGCGYYPLPSFMARFMCKIDAKHASYLIVKARKSMPLT